jgi:hypothetical protein
VLLLLILFVVLLFISLLLFRLDPPANPSIEEQRPNTPGREVPAGWFATEYSQRLGMPRRTTR